MSAKARTKTRGKSRSKSKAPRKREHAQLTDYEAQQVEEIAAWKSAAPNRISELVKWTTLPLAKVVEQVIPDSVAEAAIEKAYETADFLAGQRDVMKKAGVKTLEDLRHKPLEECDRLASAVGIGAQGISLIEGAVTGFGGMATTALDIPLLFGLALRTIIKIGHCYGYPLDQEYDQRYVLQILVIGACGSLDVRQERLNQLRDIEKLAVEEAQDEIVTEEVLSFVFQLEEFEEIPGVGAVSGALLNYAFMRRMEVTARRIFQERWLRDNGKVEQIEAAPRNERVPGSSGLLGILGRATYQGCYYVGFGASLPFWFVAASLPNIRDNALTRGLREGAAAASAGANRLVGRASGEANGRPQAESRRLKLVGT
jgi:hypothetical protein